MAVPGPGRARAAHAGARAAARGGGGVSQWVAAAGPPRAAPAVPAGGGASRGLCLDACDGVCGFRVGSICATVRALARDAETSPCRTAGDMRMRVVTLKDIPILPVEGAAEQTSGWTGPVSRSRQTIIPPGDSANYNCSVVHFSQGCNTGWHTHDCDQLLIVTSGAGYVATEQEQREIHVGDVVQIKAGERHWHGAKADTT